MYIIIKFILKNIREKKLRTFLIIFSITVSTALFLASMASSDNIGKMSMERAKAFAGNAEILVYAGDKSPSRFFKSSGANTLRENFEFISEVFGANGYYKFKNGNIEESIGFDLGGLDGIDPVTLNKTKRIQILSQCNLYPFSGKKLIVGKLTAEKYGFKLGETVDIFIEGSKHRFLVSGIAAPEGIFLDDGIVNRIIMPIETVSGILGQKGKVTTLLIKPKNLEQKQHWIDELSKIYNNYIVKDTFTKDDLKQAVQGVTVVLSMAMLLVILISIYIINASFKVITAERLPMIGTFRSIGATRRMTDFVILVESMSYGVIGGIAGCVMGWVLVVIILKIMVNGKSSTQLGFSVTINPLYIIASFLLAVLLSLVSSLMPIIRVSKIPIKEIVLNKIEKITRNKKWKPLIGILLLAVSIAAPPIVPNSIALPADLLCLVFVSISIVTFIPYITNGLVKIFEKVYVLFFGNIGMLAVKNLRGNKSILTNITLLSMGISALIMIFTLSSSVFTTIAHQYDYIKFDIRVTYVDDADRRAVGQIQNIDGVKDVFGLLAAENVNIKGSKERIEDLMGVDKDRFPQFFDMECEGNQQKLFQELDTGRNIILSSTLRNRLNVTKGDILSLQSRQGLRDYKIIGFLDSSWSNGRSALISEPYIKMDFNERYFNDILIKTYKSPEAVLKEFKERFKSRHIFALTRKDFQASDDRKFGPITSVMKGFSVMAMVIGIFGILNNFAISFLERKRSISLMRSVGLSKNQTILMIFIEALSGGIIGGIIGIIGGILTTRVIPYVLLAIEEPEISMSYSPALFTIFLLCGIGVSVVASISPAFKSSKLNIVEELKYE